MAASLYPWWGHLPRVILLMDSFCWSEGGQGAPLCLPVPSTLALHVIGTITLIEVYGRVEVPLGLLHTQQEL